MAERMVSEQQGSRWVHNPPDGAVFSEWFEKNVPMHPGLEPGRYVNGVVLIPNKETVKVTERDETGARSISEVEQLVFSPYPQVETRVRYFWDFCRENGYVGAIEVVPVRDQKANLPTGVFPMTVEHAGKSYTYLGMSYQVRVFEPSLRTGGRGKVVMEPPKGTKMVPLVGRFGPDVNAPMRVETGAIGRALGFAGMLIVPGAGIASAEDMHDFLNGEDAAPGGGPALPTGAATSPLEAPAPAAVEQPAAAQAADLLPGVVEQLITDLMAYPAAWDEMTAWATERGLPLDNIAPAALRPLEKQLRRKLTAAQAAAA